MTTYIGTVFKHATTIKGFFVKFTMDDIEHEGFVLTTKIIPICQRIEVKIIRSDNNFNYLSVVNSQVFEGFVLK
jgi:hypothetical protein